MTTAPSPEFSGVKGRLFAWVLTSPLRRAIEWRMGKPEDRILALLRLEGHERVLDAGCGSGFHSLLIARSAPGCTVVAVDVSSEMLDQLRRNAQRAGLTERVEVLLADGLNLPLPDGSVDRAISAAVWHHLSDPERACAELVRALRPGGRVVVSDLAIEARASAEHGHHSHHGHHGHDRPFAAEDMRRILLGAGLDNVEVESVGRWILGAGDKPGDVPV